MNEIEVIESEFDCSKIEERMQSYIDRGILSCCSTLLMKGSEVVDYRTFGFMDLEDKQALRKDAIYRITRIPNDIFLTKFIFPKCYINLWVLIF